MDKQIDQTVSSHKLRVLIVEDQPSARESHVDNVRRWGYEPVIADGLGYELLENAVQLTRQQRCHLALVDKQLRGSFNPGDISGVELIEKLKPTVTILVTGFADYESTEAAHQAGAFAVVAKRLGPNAVHETLDKAAQERWHPDIQILWPHGWSAKQLLQEMAVDGSKADEIDDLLRCLFPTAHQLRPKRMIASTKTPARRRRSAVFLIAEDDRIPVVVKLNNRKQTQQEKVNYEKYIKGHLSTNSFAILNREESLWNLGGLVYTLIEGNHQIARTFTEHYRSVNDIETIHQPLRDHFENVWRAHFQNVEEMEALLPDNYLQKGWKERLLPTADGFDEGFDAGMTPGLSNPFRWILHHAQESDALVRRMQCVVHGSLRCDDLLVDERGESWVVDFEDTGPGHILRDFVSLEIDLALLTLADSSTDQQAYYEIFYLLSDCQRPLYSHELRAVESTQRVAGNRSLQKLYQVVIGLRSLASHITGYVDQREYLWGLLLESIRRLLENDMTLEQRRRLKLWSGMLCTRLETWGSRGWLLPAWPAVETISASKATQTDATAEQKYLTNP